MKYAPSTLLRTGPTLLVALLGCAALWGVSDAFPGGNNYYHLPIVLDYARSAEGPHDEFHRSLDNFVSLVWPGLRLVATEQNVAPLFLSLLLLVSALTAMGGLALARAVGAGGWLAALAIGVVSFGFGAREFMEVGGGELLAGFLTHSQVATAIALFSLAQALRGRWVSAALLAGLSADANLFLGFWLMVSLAAAYVVLERRSDVAAPARTLAAMGAAWLVVASPVLAWALSLPRAQENFSFTEFLYVYHPYHFFVHLEIWLYLAAVGVALTILVIAREIEPESRPLRTLAVLGVVAVLAPGLGSAALYLTDNRLLLNLAPLRFLSVAHWIAAGGVVAFWVWLEKRQSPRAAFAAAAVLGFLLATPPVTVAGLLLMHERERSAPFQRLLLLLALLAALVAPTLSTGRETFPEITRALQFPALLFVSVVGGSLVMLRGPGTVLDRAVAAALLWAAACSTAVGGLWPGLLLAASVTALGAALLFQWHRGVVLVALAAAAAILATAATGDADLLKLIGGTTLATVTAATACALLGARIPMSVRSLVNRGALATLAVALVAMAVRSHDSQGFDFPHWPKDDDWHAVQEWSRAHTAPDTLFYSPDRNSFATLARRPVWYDPNDGPAVMWSPGFHTQWDARRQQAAQVKTVPHLVALARAEGIGFLVLERRRLEEEDTSGLQQRYCNTNYCVAEVTVSTEAERLARARSSAQR